MDNYFIDSIADANGLDFSNYKIVSPNEYGAVLMKVGRDGRLTIIGWLTVFSLLRRTGSRK